MARGIGATQGVGTTDSIELQYATNATVRSYSVWTNRRADDIDGGRIFDKRVSGAENELLFFNQGDTTYHFIRVWSTTRGHWHVTAPGTGSWVHVLVTYDGGATTNDPIIYHDAVSQSVTEDDTPDGTISTNADNYVLGNRKNDDARHFDGDLAEFAIWDRILSQAEATALAKGASPLFLSQSLVSYTPMIRTVTDRLGAAPTVTGTAVQVHDFPIFYPAPKFYIMAPPAAGGVTVTVPVASLTLTGFAPTVTVSDHQSVTVPVASLSLTGFAPIVTATANVSIEIPVASLALAGFAPTVTATANVSIEVPVASLTLAGFAPTVTATGDVSITVPVASLALAGFAPTVQTPVTVTIPVASLTLTGFAPTIQTPVSVTVPVASLSLSGFAPTVTATANVSVTVPVASLALSGFSPTVTATGNVSVTVPVASLALTGFAPTIVTLSDVSDVDFVLDTWDVENVLDTWDVESVLDTWNVEFILTTES